MRSRLLTLAILAALGTGFATAPGPRGASGDELSHHIHGDKEKFVAPAEAFAAALKRAGENDKIVVFGSFLTVGEVMGWLKNNKTSKR